MQPLRLEAAYILTHHCLHAAASIFSSLYAYAQPVRSLPLSDSLAECVVQGAFMAALYSQGLAWEQMHHLVREYARQMSSVQHLLWDLTLPIMSIFNGVGFDRVVRETFKHGAQQIEDLWLRLTPPFPQSTGSIVGFVFARIGPLPQGGKQFIYTYQSQAYMTWG